MSVNSGSILGAFRLLARLLPATPLAHVTAITIDELSTKYRRRDRWCNVIGLMAFAGCAVAYGFLLVRIAAWHYRDLEHLGGLFRPGLTELWVFAAFLSLTSSSCIVLRVLRRSLGRKEYAVYLAYVSDRAHPSAPFDVAKVFRWFFWLGCLPLAVFTALSIDAYTAFADDSIIDSPFWSVGIEVEQPYSAVSGVYEVRGYHARFEDKVAPYQVIMFADGTRWETPHGRGGPKLERQREIMRFVAARSGGTVRAVEFAEELPPQPDPRRRPASPALLPS